MKPRPPGILPAALAGRAVGAAIGWGVRLYAAVFLGAGAVALTVGWQQGPKPAIEARDYAPLTARAEGRIVEAWLAIEFEPAAVGGSRHWRAAAKASPCAVVEYEGAWGETARRAYCGNRLGFNESYTLHDLKTMTPEVPFAWVRDAAGFAVPEIRLGADAARWLAANAGTDVDPGNKAEWTAMAQLRRELDRPLETAIESWAATPPALALAVDPQVPDSAMPVAHVQARLAGGPAWFLSVLFLGAGFWAWLAGASLLLPAMPRPAAALFALLPLVALPWWGDALPRYLRSLNAGFATVTGDMIGDLDRTTRLVASEPARAALAEGVALRIPVDAGDYADTFGRIRYARPEPPPRDGDAALAALAAQAGEQVRAMAPDERTALFARLARDKRAGRRGAGLVFVPAARDAVLDAGSSPGLRRAAGDFLSAWVTQPVEEPWPAQAGYAERVRIYRSLAEVPIADVAIMSASIAERAAARK